MLAWPDRLRNLATVMVIAIHVSGPVAEQHPDLNSWEWWIANWYDAISRVSVPLFVLLSGALLLPKDYETGPFLRKRLTRVLIPALIWMCVYNFYNYMAQGQPDSIKAALIRMLESPVHYHLWFIYLIIGLYMMYPLLRPWVRTARDEDYWYVFVLCALAAWGYKLLFTFWGLKIGLYWETFSNNVGYFILGCYLAQKPLRGEPAHPTLRYWTVSNRQLMYIAIGLIIAGSAATAYGAYWASTTVNGGKFHRYFYDYLTPNVGAAVIGWFLLARLAWNNRPLLQFEKEFATASFGIYLIHVLVMDFWSQNGFWFGAAHPFKTIPVVIGMVALTAFLIVRSIQAVPGGDRVV